jgi:IclR family acetate operon transcriptional repressor
MDLHKISRRPMEELAERCEETISLAVRDGGEVVYIEIVRGQAEIGIQSRIGARQPCHCTALGKVLLAWCPGRDRERLVYSRPLQALTTHTITDRERLEEHLALVREQDFAVDDQERALGIRCVAAPIRNYTGQVVAALSVSGAAFSFKGATLEASRRALVDACAGISRELGWRPATGLQVAALGVGAG